MGDQRSSHLLKLAHSLVACEVRASHLLDGEVLVALPEVGGWRSDRADSTKGQMTNRWTSSGQAGRKGVTRLCSIVDTNVWSAIH